MNRAGRGALASFAVLVAAAGAWLLLREGDRAATHGGADGLASSVPERAAATAAPGRPAATESVRRAPFATPAPDADLPPGILELRLRDAAGRPAAGARALLGKDASYVASERADAQGRVRFPADDAAAWVVVLVEGAAPLRRDVRLAAGVVEFRADAGAAVAGRATLDGRPAPAGAVFTLTADAPFPGTEDLGVGVWKAAGLDPRAAFEIATTLDADGAFLWTGLPAEFSGRLTWPVAYEGPTAETLRDAVVPAPTTDLRLALRSAPALTGRVVSADGLRPEPKAVVRVRIAWGMQGAAFDVVADGEGRFAHPLVKCPASGRPPVAVVVEVADREGRGRRTRTVSGDFAAALDAGDLALAPPPVRRVVVVTDDGGATRPDARLDLGASAPFAADADGRIAFEGDGVATLVAPGCVRATLPAGAGVGDAASIVLRRAGSVDVRATTRAGKAADDVFVRFSGPGVPAAAVAADALFRAVSTGAVVATGERDGARRVVMRPDAEGRVILGEADADAEILIELVASAAVDAPALASATARPSRGELAKVMLTKPR